MAIQPIGVTPGAVVDDNAIVIDHLIATSSEAVLTARAFAERTQQVDVAAHVEMFVDLGDLPTLDAFPELQKIDFEVRDLGVNTVDALASVAGGTAAGAAVSAITFAGVGALATASTGTAIASLSGAAATSATLAWLGGPTGPT